MTSSGRPDARVQWALLSAALLIVVLIHAPHGLPFNWDDQGQYLSHARALLEGRPYGDIGFIYTGYNNFIGPVVEPPGVPVLIAPALAVSGDALIPVRVVMLATLVTFLALSWRHVERHSGSWMASAAILLSLASFSAQHAVDGVMSDLPFCAAVWVVIAVAEGDRPLTRRRLLAMAVAGAIAFSFRMAALALLPALVLMVVTRPRREWPGLAMVGVAWAGAAASVMYGLPTSTALAAEATRAPARFLNDITENLGAMLRGIQQGFLYPFTSNPVNNAWHVVSGILSVIGGWLLLRARPRDFAHLFALSSIAMLVVLPTNANRYWWPLIPLQLQAMIEGAAFLLKRTGDVPRWWPAPVAIVFSVLAMARSAREPATPFTERDDVRAVIAAMRAAAPDDSIRVTIVSPRLFTWHTRVPAMGHFFAGPEQMLSELRDKRITFLVRGMLGESRRMEASVAAAIAGRPDGYQKVGEFGELTLYRVLP